MGFNTSDLLWIATEIISPSLGIFLDKNNSLEKERDKVILTISDNGVGIPENVKDRIFDRFFQVDTSSTRKHGGTGIGLSITRELVHLHGGEISVKSEVDQGTTFSLVFPSFDVNEKVDS